MSDEKPEALLKSALEKILYFEARSSQLTNDADTTRSELERFKADLGAASQREIELRRVIAELEVRVTRAHSEREEAARLADALRRERADLVGKMLEASRIHGLERGGGLDDFDLGQFIAQLRSEVLVERGGSAPVLAGLPPTNSDTVAGVANELKAQGRLTVSANEMSSMMGGQQFPGRSEETLFGFSVRELSAPDATARVRAADRLKALRHPAATPALATALHGEREPSVQVALLGALASLAKVEALPVVMPLLTSSAPEVRIAALKAMITLDAPAAAPHLAAATKDPDKAVRRRASLLALGLSGKEALELGTQAIRDGDADVRSLAALVLGASNAEVARPLLMEAMRDSDLRVRRAASQSLSRLLGQDVTSLVSLDDAQRRREVRRLANVPSRPVSLSPRSEAGPAERWTSAAEAERKMRQGEATREAGERAYQSVAASRPSTSLGMSGAVKTAVPAALTAPQQVVKTRVAVLELAQTTPAPALLASALRELRASIRGRQLPELAEGIGASTEETLKVCGALMAQGQVVRRGLKYFVA